MEINDGNGNPNRNKQQGRLRTLRGEQSSSSVDRSAVGKGHSHDSRCNQGAGQRVRASEGPLAPNQLNHFPYSLYEKFLILNR